MAGSRGRGAETEPPFILSHRDAWSRGNGPCCSLMHRHCQHLLGARAKRLCPLLGLFFTLNEIKNEEQTVLTGGQKIKVKDAFNERFFLSFGLPTCWEGTNTFSSSLCPHIVTWNLINDPVFRICDHSMGRYKGKNHHLYVV